MRKGAKTETTVGQRTEPGPGSLCCYSVATPAQLTARTLAVTVNLLTGAYKFLWKQNLTKLYHRGVQVCFLFYNKPYDQNQLKAGRASTLHFREHSTTKESWSRGTQAAAMEECYSATACSLCSHIPQDHPEWEWAR